MHEHSFIEAILRDAQKMASSEVAGGRWQDVKKISLEVGELAGIEAGHLKEHMEEGRNFEVEVSAKESKVECECGFDGKARVLERLHDIVVFDCPQCGGIPRVLEGNKIRILKVTYRD